MLLHKNRQRIHLTNLFFFFSFNLKLNNSPFLASLTTCWASRSADTKCWIPPWFIWASMISWNSTLSFNKSTIDYNKNYLHLNNAIKKEENWRSFKHRNGQIRYSIQWKFYQNFLGHQTRRKQEYGYDNRKWIKINKKSSEGCSFM